MTEYAIDLHNINKTFPGVQALKGVSFRCEIGEIHALVGENGAGKSTLIKIIAGVLEPDPGSGRIIVKGDPVELENPLHAQELGISVIYQEFNLLPWLTVAENISIGRLPTYGLGYVNWKKVYERAEKSLQQLGVEIDLKRKVIDLSVAEQQIVEIAKALSMQSEIIIMDEPSAVLAGHELENLFELLRKVREQGVTVIYISHRLGEVFDIADKATVLKDGEVMGTLVVEEADKSKLIHLMIGRKLDEAFPEAKNGRGETVLEVEGLGTLTGLSGINLHLLKGEVLGLAGLVGSGRSELARAIFGIDEITEGEIKVDGRPVRIGNPQRAVDMGIGFVPEDRKTQGLVLSLSIRKNISLPILDKLQSLGLIDEKQEAAIVEKQIEQLSIKAPSKEQEVRFLSGGNQQKVVLAKWLSTNPRVIILDEPTRGIDVGTKMEMYHLIRSLADGGAGIIMISSELPEIIGMSDRVLVMCEGVVAGELEGEDINEERILRLAIGE